MANQKTPTSLLLTPEGTFHSFGYTARDYYHDLDPEDARDWLYFEKFKMKIHSTSVSPWSRPHLPGDLWGRQLGWALQRKRVPGGQESGRAADPTTSTHLPICFTLRNVSAQGGELLVPPSRVAVAAEAAFQAPVPQHLWLDSMISRVSSHPKGAVIWHGGRAPCPRNVGRGRDVTPAASPPPACQHRPLSPAEAARAASPRQQTLNTFQKAPGLLVSLFCFPCQKNETRSIL